jgi:hypothetical protein
MTRLPPRVPPLRTPRWLTSSAWLIGAVLFIRLTQILPCCQASPIEVALRSNICAAARPIDCPRYTAGAPR